MASSSMSKREEILQKLERLQKLAIFDSATQEEFASRLQKQKEQLEAVRQQQQQQKKQSDSQSQQAIAAASSAPLFQEPAASRSSQQQQQQQQQQSSARLTSAAVAQLSSSSSSLPSSQNNNGASEDLDASLISTGSSLSLAESRYIYKTLAKQDPAAPRDEILSKAVSPKNSNPSAPLFSEQQSSQQQQQQQQQQPASFSSPERRAIIQRILDQKPAPANGNVSASFTRSDLEQLLSNFRSAYPSASQQQQQQPSQIRNAWGEAPSQQAEEQQYQDGENDEEEQEQELQQQQAMQQDENEEDDDDDGVIVDDDDGFNNGNENNPFASGSQAGGDDMASDFDAVADEAIALYHQELEQKERQLEDAPDAVAVASASVSQPSSPSHLRSGLLLSSRPGESPSSAAARRIAALQHLQQLQQQEAEQLQQQQQHEAEQQQQHHQNQYAAMGAKLSFPSFSSSVPTSARSSFNNLSQIMNELASASADFDGAAGNFVDVFDIAEAERIVSASSSIRSQHQHNQSNISSQHFSAPNMPSHAVVQSVFGVSNGNGDDSASSSAYPFSLPQSNNNNSNSNSNNVYFQSEEFMNFVNQRSASFAGAPGISRRNSGGSPQRAKSAERQRPVSASSSSMNAIKSPTIPQEFAFSFSRRLPPSEAKLERLMYEMERDQMSECTFTPRINHSYSSHQNVSASSHNNVSSSSASSGKFFDRMMSWKKEKQRQVELTKQEIERTKLESCTFRPNINPTSSSSLEDQSLLHHQPQQHQQHQQQLSSSAVSASSDQWRFKNDTPVSERLYNHSFIRAKLMEEERKRVEEEALQQSCTFKPKLVAKPPPSMMNGGSPPQSKFMELARSFSPSKSVAAEMSYMLQQQSYNMDGSSVSPELQRRAAAASPAPPSECTFTPTINRNIPKSFTHARSYLQQDVVTRLTQQPRTVGASSSNGAANLEEEFFATVSAVSSASNSRPSSAPSRRPGSAMSNGRPQTPSGGPNRGASFSNFLERQEQNEMAKQRKLERMKKQDEQQKPSFKPAIDAHSARLVESVSKGGFLDRMEKKQMQSTVHHQKLEQQVIASMLDVRDSESKPFTPKINEVSKKLPGKSVDRLSTLEAIQRRARLEAVKKAMEKQSTEGLTFRPKTLDVPNAQSKLQVVNDPEAYRQFLEQRRQEQEKKAEKLKAQQEQKELEQCSFAPQVHTAPEYVRRIARSMQLTRGGPRPAPAPSNDWK